MGGRSLPSLSPGEMIKKLPVPGSWTSAFTSGKKHIFVVATIQSVVCPHHDFATRLRSGVRLFAFSSQFYLLQHCLVGVSSLSLVKLSEHLSNVKNVSHRVRA